MYQAHLRAYIDSIYSELKRVKDKDELIDSLKWIAKRLENYEGL
jgi:hypothetical protein